MGPRALACVEGGRTVLVLTLWFSFFKPNLSGAVLTGLCQVHQGLTIGEMRWVLRGVKQVIRREACPAVAEVTPACVFLGFSLVGGENSPELSHRPSQRDSTAWQDTPFQRIPDSQLEGGGGPPEIIHLE